jgi:hypothetical protein
MKTYLFSIPIRKTLMAAAHMSAMSPLASAVTLDTYAMKPSQWGTGSAYYHGHTVTATTPYNLLNAGGTFTVQCNHPATVPMTGERALGSSTAGRTKNVLVVTIPEKQPAVRNVTGWLQVPGNTTLSCNYRWTAFATEGGYSIGAGGVGVTFGNETRRDGDTIDFEMYRPYREDADGGCIP